jgi:hypothetical protein
LLYPTSLHIFQIHELPGGEHICILKTFWLKCIQRKWRKICNFNKSLIEDLKKTQNLHLRELGHYSKKSIGITGLWHRVL